MAREGEGYIYHKSKNAEVNCRTDKTSPHGAPVSKRPGGAMVARSSPILPPSVEEKKYTIRDVCPPHTQKMGADS